jgi:hypothetical protein
MNDVVYAQRYFLRHQSIWLLCKVRSKLLAISWIAMKANTGESRSMVSSCLANSDKINSPKQLEKQRNSSVLTIQCVYFLYVGFSSLTIAFRSPLDCSYVQVRLDRNFRISKFPLIWLKWQGRYVINNSNDNETIPKCKCNVPKSCK